MKSFGVTSVLLLTLVFASLSVGEAHAQGTGGAITVLTNCNVIDCTGRPVQEDMTVVIEGNKIASISQGGYEPDGQSSDVRLIDLEGAYVLPGFWNMHTHLTDLYPKNHKLDNESSNAKLIRGGINAMDGL